MGINYLRILRRLDKKLAAKENQPFCSSCWTTLNSTMERHRKYQAQPSSLCFEGTSEPSLATIPAQDRPVLDDDVDQPKSKRAKHTGKEKEKDKRSSPKSSKDRRAVK